MMDRIQVQTKTVPQTPFSLQLTHSVTNIIIGIAMVHTNAHSVGQAWYAHTTKTYIRSLVAIRLAHVTRSIMFVYFRMNGPLEMWWFFAMLFGKPRSRTAESGLWLEAPPNRIVQGTFGMRQRRSASLTAA